MVKKYLPLIIILSISAFLRFWNLVNLIHFTLDEELEAFIVKNIVTGHHLPAIGVSVAPVGIYLSPLFYYLASIPFFLSQESPIGWAITASIVGILSTFAFYITTDKMFSRRIATISSLFYATSFLMVMYDKHFWNVTPIVIISILIVYSLYMVIQGKLWWSVLIGILLSVAISSHLSSLVFLILIIGIWWKFKIPIIRKATLISFGVIILSQLPLVVFELRHNFFQTRAIAHFLLGQHTGLNGQRIYENLMLLLKVFSRLIYTFGPHDFAREETYGVLEIAARDIRIPQIMLVLALILIIMFILKSLGKNSSIALRIHAFLIGLTSMSLIIYGLLFKGSIFEFYLMIIFPSLFLVLAVFIDNIWIFSREIAVSIIMLIVGMNTYAVITSSHSYGLGRKLELINWVKYQLNGQPYELQSIGVDHKYEGYRYLFEYYYQPPISSYVDPQLGWLYPKSSSLVHPKLTVVLSSTEKDYQSKIDLEKGMFLKNKVTEKQFGEINVLVVKTDKINL